MLTRAHTDFLTEEQRMVRDMAREFSQAELRPHAGQWEEEGWIPDAVVAKLGELGLLGMVVPEVLATASKEARATWYDRGYAIPAPGSCKLEKIIKEGQV